MNEKNFEKINIKTVISMQQCISPHFPVFGLDTKIYRVNFRIQSKCGKIRTKKNLLLQQILVHLENFKFWDQICLQNISDKNFGEINTKIVINIHQCTSQPNFSQFGEFKFLGLKFAKKALYDGIGHYNLAISRKQLQKWCEQKNKSLKK